jgi:hypothetical protein
VRENCLVIKLEYLGAVIQAQQVVLFDIDLPITKKFAVNLRFEIIM